MDVFLIQVDKIGNNFVRFSVTFRNKRRADDKDFKNLKAV